MQNHTNPISVLSLCDGISGGNNALELAGIPVRWYVASEIDKHAIKITQKNYPATIQIGDIMNVNVAKIPFKIDLVLSGTPCTSFSVAGNMLGFEAESGQLFFQFCKILAQVRKKSPNVLFLFENVASMKKEVRDTITTYLGVEPMKIDSALVSAQTRKRLYWMNWDCPQPEDRGIILQDILEHGVDVKYHLSDKILERINKDEVLKRLIEYRLSYREEKTYAIMASEGRQTIDDFAHRRKGTFIKTASKQLNPVQEFGNQPHRQLTVHNLQPRSGKGQGSKAYCLDTANAQAVEYDLIIRRLTEVECMRLQDFPDDYFYDDNGKLIISPTQVYRSLGNSWQCATIAHILSYMPQSL